MQTAPAPSARKGKQTTYRLEHCETGLCIRLHCEPAPFGEGLRIVPQLSHADKASRFPAHDAAVIAANHYMPHTPVEIVRVDA